MGYQQQISGGLFEAVTFGRCGAPYMGKRPWQVEADCVRKHQPATKAPKLSRLEQEFHARGLKVCFYTAVGSGLDRHYGTDGFCEYCGAIVSLDLTTNPNKHNSAADLIVHEIDFEDMQVLVLRIAHLLMLKLDPGCIR